MPLLLKAPPQPTPLAAKPDFWLILWRPAYKTWFEPMWSPMEAADLPGRAVGNWFKSEAEVNQAVAVLNEFPRSFYMAGWRIWVPREYRAAAVCQLLNH